MSDSELSLFAASPRTGSFSVPIMLRWLPALLILLCAILARNGAVLNTDNSWLLSLGERWLAGEVPYVDFIEVNPPASILLYMPAVLAGHWLGVAPEFCVTVLMFAGVLLSLVLTGRILRRAGLLTSVTAPWWATACVFLFLLLPGYVFAQREHIAAVLVLPVLAIYATALAGRPARWPAQIAAGLAGGVCVAIKPYFGFALLLPLAFAFFSLQGAWTPRLKLLFGPVNLVIAAIVAAYAAVVALCFPAFTHDILPLVLAVYVPVKIPLLLALAWAAKCWLPGPFLLLRVVEPNRRPAPLLILLILASLGFAIALVIQGKAWPYHVFPTLTLGILVLFCGLAEAVLAGRVRLLAPAIVAAMLGCAAMTAYASYLFSSISYAPNLVTEVRKLGIAHPKILTISSDIALGHPLTREVGGQWVDRLCSHWITVNADVMLTDGRTLSAEERTRLEAFAAFDLASLLKDIAQRQPDIILVEENWWRRWGAPAPEIVAALNAYREVTSVEGVTILRRGAS